MAEGRQDYRYTAVIRACVNVLAVLVLGSINVLCIVLCPYRCIGQLGNRYGLLFAAGTSTFRSSRCCKSRFCCQCPIAPRMCCFVLFIAADGTFLPMARATYANAECRSLPNSCRSCALPSCRISVRTKSRSPVSDKLPCRRCVWLCRL